MWCYKYSIRLFSPLRHVTCSRGLVSSESVVETEGFTRSIYFKPLCKEIVLNGKPLKVFTGLVDPSHVALADDFSTILKVSGSRQDLDFAAFTKWIGSYVKERNRLRQIVAPADIQRLGVDLAVAHMICRIGGRVQFVGHEKWFFSYAGLHSGLPHRYPGDLRLESIDLSGTNVVYEGFELLPQLTELHILRLRRCLHVDDFCLSRVGRIAGLNLLDIGECPRLTTKGLASLAQLKSLRHLLIHNNPMMENKELVCLMLEDHLPKLSIGGVDYLDALPDRAQRDIVKMITESTVQSARQTVDPPASTDDCVFQRALN